MVVVTLEINLMVSSKIEKCPNCCVSAIPFIHFKEFLHMFIRTYVYGFTTYYDTVCTIEKLQNI